MNNGNGHMKIKAKSGSVLTDKFKLLRLLENLEMQTIEDEKDARTDLATCKPSRLFNLIAMASFYRATTGTAEELYPDDLDIGEHVKSSKNLLTDKALKLTSRFEEDCECKIKK